jgi:hypothetical protein
MLKSSRLKVISRNQQHYVNTEDRQDNKKSRRWADNSASGGSMLIGNINFIC